MGYGSYSAADWTKLKSSRGISQSSGADEIFKGNDLKEKYNPKFINIRESCDSDDSPLSTPIILGFDVTGSMGYLAAEIAKNSLNKTITEIYDKQPVTNPHVMCAAFTQPMSNGGLQVTQFEADIRVVEQLLELKVQFGGNWYSYDSLVWYFAAKHTKIDCYEKRGKKGFIFCVGDEICGFEKGEKLSITELKNVFNDESDKDYGLREIYEMASEKYEIFHIITGDKRAIPSWNEFMKGRVAYIHQDNISNLSEVITSIMQIVNGIDKEKVLGQWSEEVRPIVEKAIETIKYEKTEVKNDKLQKETIDKNDDGGEKETPKSFIERLFRK